MKKLIGWRSVTRNFNKPVHVPHSIARWRFSNTNPGIWSSVKQEWCLTWLELKIDTKIALHSRVMYSEHVYNNVRHYIFHSTLCMWTSCCQPLWHQGLKVQTLTTACTVSRQTVQVHNRLNYCEQCLTITWTWGTTPRFHTDTTTTFLVKAFSWKIHKGESSNPESTFQTAMLSRSIHLVSRATFSDPWNH